MTKRRIAVLAALLFSVVLIGAGIAWASIPGPDGVIHGCRKNTDGSLRVIDSAATCPNGYTALNWQGSAGYETVSASVALSPSPGGDTQASIHADCPVGKVATGGGATIVNGSADPGFTTSERLQISLPRLTVGMATGWDAEIAYSTTFGSFTGSLTVYAICSYAS